MSYVRKVLILHTCDGLSAPETAPFRQLQIVGLRETEGAIHSEHSLPKRYVTPTCAFVYRSLSG